MANNRDATQIVYPELSYKIIGAAFGVFNNLGYGLREDFYEKALAREFKSTGLDHERQKRININFKGDKIGCRVIDFVVENKIAIELKARPKLGYPHIKQVVEYLTSGNYRLAILIYFTREGIRYRRVLNPNFKVV